MDVQLAKYHGLRNFLQKLLLLGGIWPHPNGEIRFYRIISTYGTVMCGSVVAKIFFYCLENANAVSVVVSGLSIMLSICSVFLKLIIFVAHREDLTFLENELRQKFEMELENKENRPVLLKRISMYTKFTRIVACLLFVSVAVFALSAISNIVKKNYLEGFPGRYPFTVVPGSPLYWVVFSCEFTVSYYIWTVSNGVDNGFGLHCCRITGLIRLAGYHLSKLRPDDPNHRDQLHECVKILEIVLRAKEALQRVYGIIVLWTYVTNAISMCSLLWQANQTKKIMTPFKAIYFICFIGMKLLQAYTYAYYGSLVSQESEDYEDSIYKSNWPGSGDVRLMKDLLIIRTQRTVTFKACGYFLITMEMFEKIANTTISYFFLLQTVESKNQ